MVCRSDVIFPSKQSGHEERVPLALIINGEMRTVSDLEESSPLTSLLVSMSVRRETAAIALNDIIVPRAHWDATTVSAGDRVEIVHFVGGGL